MIRQGTTPTIKINISGINHEEFEKKVLTIKQGEVVISKNAEFVEDHYEVYLSQEDTLLLDSNKEAKLQMKFKTTSGQVVASGIISKTILEILDKTIL